MYMLYKFILIGLGLMLGDVLMKEWSSTNYALSGNGIFAFVGALICYAAALIYYAMQLRSDSFGDATILPIIINVVAALLLTTFIYHEPLSLKQMAGAFLSIAAIFLLQ